MAFILLYGQQTVSVICDVAHSLFKKLRSGDRDYCPTLGLDIIKYHPNATFSVDERMKTNSPSLFSEEFLTVHLGTDDLISNTDTFDYKQYLVPRDMRTYSSDKFDMLYVFVSRTVQDYEGVDTVSMLRSVMLPSMDNNIIMVVVDTLAYLHKDVNRTFSRIAKRRRFTKQQKHTIWARSLKRDKMCLPRVGRPTRMFHESELHASDLPMGDVYDSMLRVDDQGITAPEQHIAMEQMNAAIKRLNGRRDEALFSKPISSGVVADYSDMLFPVAVLVYNMYRSRDTADAIVAILSFGERLSARSGHTHLRAAATWVTSYVTAKYDEVASHVNVLHEYFSITPKTELHSSDYLGVLESLANGISKSSHARAFVYLTSFAFMGVTASLSGIAPDINAFSKQALEISNRLDFMRTTTGTTFGLLTHAIQLCVELCSSFMRDGFQAFWSSDAKTLRVMHDKGKDLLQRSSHFTICWTHKEMVQLGVDLNAYIVDYKARKPRYDSYNMGTRVAGISFSTETNIAAMWYDVKKISESVVAAYEDYKAVLSSVAFRKAPFCVSLIAGSSVGKSSVTQYFAKWFLMYEDMEDDMKYVYTVNPNQEFLDGYYPWQSVFVLDDVATIRPEYQAKGDPQVLGVIQYVNNVSLLTNQADLSRKSCTPFLSKYVMLTSNTPDLDAHRYANNYPAILRRVKWFIHVDVHANFATREGTLDQAKCSAWYANGGRGFPPFWEYTIKLCEVLNNGTTMTNRFTIVQQHCNHEDLQDWLRATVDEHWRIQNIIMDNVSVSSAMKMCKECKRVSGSSHARDCSMAGSVVNSSVLDDMSVVASTVAASSSAAICAYFGIVSCRSLLTIVQSAIWNVRTRVTYCMCLYSDVLYHIAYLREALLYQSEIVRMLYNFVSVGVQVLLWLYCPWRYVMWVFTVLSCIPARGAVIGRVGMRQWLKPFIGTGVGLAALALAWNVCRRNRPTPGDQHADEPDFSAYESVPKWNEGRRMPYSGENLVTAWPSNSKCASGASHAGVLDKFHRNQFVALIKSEAGGTRGNGFVYAPGYVVINAHTLRRHRGKSIEVTLCYMPQERDLGAPGPEKPRNYVLGLVPPDRVYYSDECDLAMLHMPMETRQGLKNYILERGSSNFSMDPHLIGREMNGVPFMSPVSYSHTVRNTRYGGDADGFFVKHGIHFTSSKDIQSGHSGSLYVVHSGRMSVGDKGYLAIAGIHMGCNKAIDGKVCFATAFDNDTVGELYAKLHEVITSTQSSAGAHLGSLQQAFTRSASLHADVIVSDAVFDLEKGSIGGALVATHPKSAVTWLDYDAADTMMSLTVYGGLVGDSRKSQGISSAYRSTPWSGYMNRVGNHDVLGDITNKFKPAQVPKDELWRAHRMCLLDLCGGNVCGPDAKALDAAIAGYVHDVIDRVNEAGNAKSWSLIQPLSYDEVINGRDGVYDGIMKKTGGGFGYGGPKSKHVRTLVEPVPGLQKSGQHWTFDDDVMRSVREADAMLRRGEDPRFVYSCHLKDEVRLAEKIDAYKIRMICGASIPCIVLMRKYLLSLIVFMQQNPLATECAVGLNVESRQWNDLADYLRGFGGEERYIAGDHKVFDKNQTFPISYAASRVMLLLIEYANENHGRYNAGDMVAVKTILLGLCHPNYDFFGTLIRVLGTNPSGNTLTTQRNCIVNSLYMRCAFLVAASVYTGATYEVASRWYRRVVAQVNYGDDIVAAVANGFPWFNHDVIAHILGLWGLMFTHADKSTDVGRLYDKFSEITFVKRSWVYDDEIDGYLAPLDPSSLVKSLHYYHAGGALSTVQQQVCLLRDVAENALNYGRHNYDKVCGFLREVATQAGFESADFMEATDFTSYDAYIERYVANSKSNCRFKGSVYCMAPPVMKADIPTEYRILLGPHAYKEGSFNPYGNGQPLVTDVSHYPLNVDQCKAVLDSACILSGLPTWICRPAWSYVLAKWLNVQGADMLSLMENVAFLILVILARLFVCAVIPFVLCVCCCNIVRRRYGLWLVFVAYVSGDVHWLWLIGSLIAIPLYKEYLCGSFNPYGNGQDDWPVALHSNTVFAEEMLPLLDAVYEGSLPPVTINLCEAPFSHVCYSVGGRSFAHIDMSSFTVRESMVEQFISHDGVLVKCDRRVHDGRWVGRALNFPGLASTTPFAVGNWMVRRRSAMMPGEGPRVRATRFECMRDTQEIHIIYFTIDTPRATKKRKINISCPTYEPRSFVVDGTTTPPSVGGSPLP